MTARQMRDVDDLVVGHFGITHEQMMENAGRSLAAHVIDTYHPESVTVLAGRGNNGGGGLVAARHLYNRGVDVAVTVVGGDLSPATARQLVVNRSIGVIDSDVPARSSLIVDALVGYALDGVPRGRVAELICWTRRQSSPVVSLDVPSGLDATSGLVSDTCVHARSTLTLALAKVGLRVSPSVCGEIFLADISIPRLAYERLGLEVGTLFATASIVHVVQ